MKETQLPKVGKYLFRAEPFHCDFNQQLLMAHLGNILLNAADFHSNDRGFGVKYLNTVNRSWVLSRLAVEMIKMPRIYDKFYVETWCDGARHYFTSRNFAITAEDGTPYGFGKSIWAMIDTVTREPADVFAIRDGLIVDYVETNKDCPITKPSRVTVNGDAPLVRTIGTYYNDVDLNGHINSIKYLEHLLDLYDLDWYRSHRLKRFDIAYVAESHHGDNLCFYQQNEGNDSFAFKILKKNAETPEGVETCRSLLTFEPID